MPTTKYGFEYAGDDPELSRAMVTASNFYHETNGGTTCKETYLQTGKPCPCASKWREFLPKQKKESRVKVKTKAKVETFDSIEETKE